MDGVSTVLTRPQKKTEALKATASMGLPGLSTYLPAGMNYLGHAYEDWANGTHKTKPFDDYLMESRRIVERTAQEQSSTMTPDERKFYKNIAPLMVPGVGFGLGLGSRFTVAGGRLAMRALSPAKKAVGLSGLAAFGYGEGKMQRGTEVPIDDPRRTHDGVMSALLTTVAGTAGAKAPEVMQALGHGAKGGYNKIVGGVKRGFDDISDVQSKVYAIRQSEQQAIHEAQMREARHRADIAGVEDPELFATAAYYKESGKYDSAKKEASHLISLTHGGYDLTPHQSAALARAQNIIATTEHGLDRQGISVHMGNIANPHDVAIMRGDLRTAQDELSDAHKTIREFSAQRQGAARRDALLRQRPGAVAPEASPASSSHQSGGQAGPSTVATNRVDDSYVPGSPEADRAFYDYQNAAIANIQSANIIPKIDGVSRGLGVISNNQGVLQKDIKYSGDGVMAGLEQQTGALSREFKSGINDLSRQNEVMADGMVGIRDDLSGQIGSIGEKIPYAASPLHVTPHHMAESERRLMAKMDDLFAGGPQTVLPDEYGAISKDIITDRLSSGKPGRLTSMDYRDLATEANNRFEAAGLAPLPIHDAQNRARSTIDRAIGANAATATDFRKNGKVRRHIAQPRIRDAVIDNLIGHPGTLAVPLAFGLGAAGGAYGQHDEDGVMAALGQYPASAGIF